MYKHEITYTFGIACFYVSESDPEEALRLFYRYARQCFGLRKSIYDPKVVSSAPCALPAWAVGAAVVLMHSGGNTIAWDADGNKTKDEWDTDGPGKDAGIELISRQLEVMRKREVWVAPDGVPLRGPVQGPPDPPVTIRYTDNTKDEKGGVIEVWLIHIDDHGHRVVLGRTADEDIAKAVRDKTKADRWKDPEHSRAWSRKTEAHVVHFRRKKSPKGGAS